MATTTTRAARPEQRPAEAQEPEREEGHLLDRVLEQTAANIDALASRYAGAIQETQGHLRRAMLLAEGIQQLRKALTPAVMRQVMALMNSPNGFKTDRGPGMKNPTLYGEDVVRECLVTALLNGVYPVNNEFNIISGQCYIALNGYKRKVEEVPGITDVRISPGVPTPHNGQTVVRVALNWRRDGVPGQLVGPDGRPGQPFPIITVGQYTTADAQIGKAKRKAYKAAYEQITGSRQTAEDGEVGEPAEAHQAGPLPAGAPGAVSLSGAGRKDLQELARLTQGMEEAEALALLPDGVTRFEALTPEQAAVIIDRLCAGREPANAGADG